MVERVQAFWFGECDECGFAFAPAIDATQTEALYDGGYRGLDGDAPTEGWARMDFLEPVWPLLPAGPLDILDFGAGESLVPDALDRLGHRVLALDRCPPGRPRPFRRTGSLLEMGLPGASFHLVYSFQVFEHLPEPRPIFEELRRLTREGGLLVVHTDMETADRTPDLGSWWYAMPPDHCVFYRHRTFERALRGRADRIEHRDPKMVAIRVRH